MRKSIAQAPDGRILVQTSGGKPTTDRTARGYIYDPNSGKKSPEMLIMSLLAQNDEIDWQPLADPSAVQRAESELPESDD